MTNMIRWNPVRDMLTLRDTLNEVYNADFAQSGFHQGLAFPLDLYETESNYIARLVAPGLNVDQIEITWDNNVLFVKGEVEYGQLEGRPLVQEQRNGTFSRAIQFPATVDTDGIRAQLHDGILMITVPKSEAAKSRKITVHSIQS
ncbi:MAG: Hsp20/alpha crystallin family protein [Chloroflexota bacterium]